MLLFQISFFEDTVVIYGDFLFIFFGKLANIYEFNYLLTLIEMNVSLALNPN